MFDFGQKTFLGIDIGSSSIKIVEVKLSGGKPFLSNYAWLKIDGALDGNEIFSANSDSILSRAIKRMIKAGAFKAEKSCVSIPAFGGLITLIEFPEVIEQDLDQAIRFEAHKYIPTSLEEVVFSWDVVSRKPAKKIINRMTEGKEVDTKSSGVEEGGKMQVLLVAAPKNKVARYEKIIKDSGLYLDSVEIESFSLVRSLVGNDQGNFVIVDIGSRVCNIVLVEKGIIKVNRNIDAGGRDVTRAIIKSLSVDEKKAERMKSSGTNFWSRETEVPFPVLEVISGEIKRVVETYYGKNNQARVDAIILSGGTANLVGIDNYFFKTLGIKTIPGNPLGRLDYDKELDPLINKIKSHFSVAVGLALRGGD